MKKGRTRFLSHRISLLRIVFIVLALSLLVFGVGAAWTVQAVRQDLEATLPSVEKLNQTEGQKITRILSSDGKLIATLFKENYKPVAYEELGENIVNAVVAMEDRRFFEHAGVDYRGVARAALGNAVAGEIEQGARIAARRFIGMGGGRCGQDLVPSVKGREAREVKHECSGWQAQSPNPMLGGALSTSFPG